MKYSPIVLSVKRKAFRADSPNPSAADKVYLNARKQVLQRDNHTCQFCGHRSTKNEVHHINDDHEDHSLTNLVTACVLCHMCFHVSFAGIQNRGKLIYLPETSITQAGINQLCRHLWIAEVIGTGDLKNTASQLLARLDKADIHANAIIGTSSASIFGDHLSSLSDDEYAKRESALKGLYLLPRKDAYAPYIKMWAEESRNFVPEDWVETAKAKFGEWGGVV